MDEKTFARRVGRPPEDDELERTNCVRQGEAGHLLCGVCVCGMPRFICGYSHTAPNGLVLRSKGSIAWFRRAYRKLFA